MAHPRAPIGQLLSHLLQPSTPTLPNIQKSNGGVGTYPTQMHPENSQVTQCQKDGGGKRDTEPSKKEVLTEHLNYARADFEITTA